MKRIVNCNTHYEHINNISVCANCGKEGSDVTNTCNKCKMIMYCNAACKKRHRHKHKKQCEEHLQRAAERAAQLHDEKLFNQPPPKEDCPICMIRLPSLGEGSVYMICCGKVICSGCVYAFQSRATKQEHNVCPFCRSPPPSSSKESFKTIKKRMELNDPLAICDMGSSFYESTDGLRQNYANALELWHRASNLGCSDAYYLIAVTYKLGHGVEVDEKKAIHYYELAAMAGNDIARHNLGVEEAELGNMNRALKHWMIATKDGCVESLESIKTLGHEGHATKDDLYKAFHSYQAYLDEIKSDQRDEAAAAMEKYKYYESAF